MDTPGPSFAVPLSSPSPSAMLSVVSPGDSSNAESLLSESVSKHVTHMINSKKYC